MITLIDTEMAFFFFFCQVCLHFTCVCLLLFLLICSVYSNTLPHCSPDYRKFYLHILWNFLSFAFYVCTLNPYEVYVHEL